MEKLTIYGKADRTISADYRERAGLEAVQLIIDSFNCAPLGRLGAGRTGLDG